MFVLKLGKCIGVFCTSLVISKILSIFKATDTHLNDPHYHCYDFFLQNSMCILNHQFINVSALLRYN